MKINLSRPDINEADIKAVCEVLRTPNLALGPKMAEFEKKTAAYVGRRYAISANSGTSALFLCMQALGIGPGDEVITTPFTFIASINCILMVGAKPVLVDIDPQNLNIAPAGIEEKITDRTKAILPVVVFGNPAGLDEVCAIAQKHNLPVVEDSCEGIGSELKGKKVGSFGTMSTFAFYPNKQMTSGEGGMIVTDDEKLAQMCISLRNQGRAIGGGWLAHERMGYNFRLSDINCALGITQLGRLEEFIEKRQRVAKWYQEKLASDSRLIVPVAPADCRVSWFVFVVRLVDKYAQKRNDILKAMTDVDIGVSNYFPPITLQPFMVEQFGYKDGDFPVTDPVCKSTIALPFYNNLKRDEVETVCDTLQKCLDNI